MSNTRPPEPSHDGTEEKAGLSDKSTVIEDEEEQKEQQKKKEKICSTGEEHGRGDGTREVPPRETRGGVSSSSLSSLDGESDSEVTKSEGGGRLVSSFSSSFSASACPLLPTESRRAPSSSCSTTGVEREDETGEDEAEEGGGHAVASRVAILSHFLHYLHSCLPSFTRLHRRRLKRRMKILKHLLRSLSPSRMVSSSVSSPSDSSQTCFARRLSVLNRYVPLTSVSYPFSFGTKKEETQHKGEEDSLGLFSPLPEGYHDTCLECSYMKLKRRGNNLVGDPLYVPSALKIQRRACNILKALSTTDTPQLATTLIQRLLQLPLSSSASSILLRTPPATPPPLSSSPAHPGALRTPCCPSLRVFKGPSDTSFSSSLRKPIPRSTSTSSSSGSPRCSSPGQEAHSPWHEEGLFDSSSPSLPLRPFCSFSENSLPSLSPPASAASEKRQAGLRTKQEEDTVEKDGDMQHIQSPSEAWVPGFVSLFQSEVLAVGVYLQALVHAQRAGACTAARCLWRRTKQVERLFSTEELERGFSDRRKPTGTDVTRWTRVVEFSSTRL